MKTTFFDFGKGPVPARRHINADGTEGGWVANTARVASTAFIAPDAKVYDEAELLDGSCVCDAAEVFDRARMTHAAALYDNAQLYGDAELGDHAQLSEKAQVSGNARIYDSARVHDAAWVYGDAEVFGDAQIQGNARVYDSAKVSGNAILQDDAHVFGCAIVSDCVKLYDSVKVYGDAVLHGTVVLDEDTKVSSSKYTPTEILTNLEDWTQVKSELSPEEQIDNWFSYHAPSPEDTRAYEAIRRAGRELARIILAHTPACPDQAAALRKVREAVFTANAARACAVRCVSSEAETASSEASARKKKV